MALSFLFGAGTGETPASIKQKRDLVRALMGASNAPKNVGEGLNALGDGIVANVLDRRANAAETAGQNSANSLFDGLLGGGPFASPSPSSSSSGIPMTGAASEVSRSSPVPPDAIKQLIAQNVPPEMQAYATNLIGKESSFNPNAVSPTGATGLGQFTRGTGKQYGLVSDQGDMRADPVANLKALVALTNDNRNALTQALGRAPTDGELALAHQQGAGGAIALLSGKGVPAQNLAVNGVAPGTDPRAAAQKIMAFYGGSGGQQVASLDPSAGIANQAPTQAIQAQAAPSGYVDPRVSAPNSIQQPQAQPATTSPFVPQSMAQPASQQAGASAPPVQLAGNNTVPAQAPQGVDPRYLRALSNPWLSDGQKQGIQLLINQQLQQQQQAQEQQTWMARQAYAEQQKQADPEYQLGLQKTRADIANQQTPAQQEAARRADLDYQTNLKQKDPAYQIELQQKQLELDRAKKTPGQIKVVGSKAVLFPDDGSPPIDVTPSGGGSNGRFRFDGSSVEGQALNGLIDAGKLTEEQAQQMGAGKTITGPNGEMMFLTPQSIFGQGGTQQQQPSPQQQGIDIFAGQPQQQQPAIQPQAQPQAQQLPIQNAPQAQPQVQPQNIPQAAPVQQQFLPQGVQQQGNGPIPLTAPKAPTEAEKSAAGYADRMADAQGQLGQYESQGLNATDQFLTQNRFVPGFLGNSLVGSDYQLFDQARRNFINSQLRRESGAVISPEEFDNANKQYFPQPGDGPDVIAQKRQNRERALNSMVRDAGPTYKAPQGAPKKTTTIGGYTIEEVSP